MSTPAKIVISTTTGRTVKACKYINATSAYEDPLVAGTLLTETPVGSGQYEAAIESGFYKIVYLSAPVTWTTILPYVDFAHVDKTMIDLFEGDTATAALDSSNKNQVVYAPTVAASWVAAPDNPADALDELVSRAVAIDGAAATGASVKYSPTTAGNWSVPPTQMRNALDVLAGRVKALEMTGAAVPTGMAYENTHLHGLNLRWANDLSGNVVHYRVYARPRIVPSSAFTLAELKLGLCIDVQQNIVELNYNWLMGMLGAPADNVELDWVVAAKYNGDGAFVDGDFCTVQSALVVFPTPKQVINAQLTGLSINSTTEQVIAGTQSLEYALTENFPTAVEDGGGVPTTNIALQDVLQNTAFSKITITCIEFYCRNYPSATTTIKYRSTTTGNGSFTVSSTTGMGVKTGIALAVNLNDAFELWSTAPNGLSHWTVKIWFVPTLV